MQQTCTKWPFLEFPQQYLGSCLTSEQGKENWVKQKLCAYVDQHILYSRLQSQDQQVILSEQKISKIFIM
jgi:hypothetical protein